MCSPPAQGYLQWLSIRASTFNVGNYRRKDAAQPTADFFDTNNAEGERKRRAAAQLAAERGLVAATTDDTTADHSLVSEPKSDLEHVDELPEPPAAAEEAAGPDRAEELPEPVPAEHVEPAEPTEPAEPVESAAPAEPTEPTKPVEPVGHAEHAMRVPPRGDLQTDAAIPEDEFVPARLPNFR